MAWVQLLALLAAEVGLIALGVALLRRWSPSAAWRRTFCQAGIIAVLVVTACELSGSARALGGWAASTLTWKPRDHCRRQSCPPAIGGPSEPPGAPAWSLSQARSRLLGRGVRAAGQPALYRCGQSTPGLPVTRRPRLVLHLPRPRQTFPVNPAAQTHAHPTQCPIRWPCLVAVPRLGGGRRAGGGAGVPGPVPVHDLPAPPPPGG